MIEQSEERLIGMHRNWRLIGGIIAVQVLPILLLAIVGVAVRLSDSSPAKVSVVGSGDDRILRINLLDGSDSLPTTGGRIILIEDGKEGNRHETEAMVVEVVEHSEGSPMIWAEPTTGYASFVMAGDDGEERGGLLMTVRWKGKRLISRLTTNGE